MFSQNSSFVQELRMTWILCLLVLASIAAMFVAFWAVEQFDAATAAVEKRVDKRLSQGIFAETEIDKVAK